MANHGTTNLSDERVLNSKDWLDFSVFEVPDWLHGADAVYTPYFNLYGKQDDIDAACKDLFTIIGK